MAIFEEERRKEKKNKLLGFTLLCSLLSRLRVRLLDLLGVHRLVVALVLRLVVDLLVDHLVVVLAVLRILLLFAGTLWFRHLGEPSGAHQI